MLCSPQTGAKGVETAYHKQVAVQEPRLDAIEGCPWDSYGAAALMSGGMGAGLVSAMISQLWDGQGWGGIGPDEWRDGVGVLGYQL